jgi:uncharacterized protein YqgC (DUF456 family)
LFWVWLILSLIIMLVGLAGTILPAVPGAPLIWGGILLFGFATGFKVIGSGILGVTFVLMLISLAVEYLASIYGARRYGGTIYGDVGALVGGILGIVMFGLLGLFLGPFAGAVIGELMGGRKPEAAFRVGVGTVIGVLGGSVLKFMIGLTMIAIFVCQIILGG